MAIKLNGITVPSRPDFGGWGGRFRRKEGGPFRDAMDTLADETSRMTTVWRWRPAFQNEFHRAMDWCVRSFDQANHPPTVALNDDRGRDPFFVEKRTGETVALRASAEDPDGDDVRLRWYQYPEAGSYTGTVQLHGANQSTCSFIAPRSDRTATIHIVLEAEDTGIPPLISYRRAVIRVRKAAPEE